MLFFQTLNGRGKTDLEVGDIVISVVEYNGDELLLLDGREVSIADNKKLYDIIKTIPAFNYTGSSNNTFKLPDFRGYSIVGASDKNNAYGDESFLKYALLEKKEDSIGNHQHSYEKGNYNGRANGGSYYYGYMRPTDNNYYNSIDIVGKNTTIEYKNCDEYGTAGKGNIRTKWGFLNQDGARVGKITRGKRIGVYFYICRKGSRLYIQKGGKKLSIGDKIIIPTIRGEGSTNSSYSQWSPVGAGENGTHNIESHDSFNVGETKNTQLQAHKHTYHTWQANHTGTNASGGKYFPDAVHNAQQQTTDGEDDGARRGEYVREKCIGVFFKEQNDVISISHKNKLISPYFTGQILMSTESELKYAILCDGRPIPEEYTNLRNLVGNNVPDFREMCLVGCDGMGTYDDSTFENAGKYGLLQFKDDCFQEHKHKLQQMVNQIKGFEGFNTTAKKFTWILGNSSRYVKLSQYVHGLTNANGNDDVTRGKRKGVNFFIAW